MDLHSKVMIITSFCTIATLFAAVVGLHLYGNK